MVDKNKELYDKLWDNIAVRGYKEYPTWKILRKFITKKSKRAWNVSASTSVIATRTSGFILQRTFFAWEGAPRYS